MNARDVFGLRRSPLSPLFSDDALRTSLEDCEMIESFRGELSAPRAGVCDLSSLPRVGAKGECAAIAPPLNVCAASADGSVCCRLGADEILILAPPSGAAAGVDKTIMPSPRLTIPRRDTHCQIGLYGAEADAVLARLCAMPPPRENALLQTRVADVAAIVASEPRASERAFYLLTESGYAAHLWEETTAAAIKMGGGIVGWKQWRALFPVRKSRGGERR